MRAEFWMKQDAWRTREPCRHRCQFQCDATRFYHLAQQEKQMQIFPQRHVRHRNPAVWKTSEDASSYDRQQIRVLAVVIRTDCHSQRQPCSGSGPCWVGSLEHGTHLRKGSAGLITRTRKANLQWFGQTENYFLPKTSRHR